MREQATTDRLFFALWPDPIVQKALDGAAKMLHAMCGGRQTRRDTIHLTLAFLGAVERTRHDVLRSLAASVEAPAFSWELCKYGWWRHNRIAWAAPALTPDALTSLVQQLNGGLKQAGFQVDERPYSPHVTLLRKSDCRHAEMAANPVAWAVSEFVLVRSIVGPEGSAYEVIGRWPLRCAPS